MYRSGWWTIDCWIVADWRWQVQMRVDFLHPMLIRCHAASTIRARQTDVSGMQGEVAEWSNALVLKTSKGL